MRSVCHCIVQRLDNGRLVVHFGLYVLRFRSGRFIRVHGFPLHNVQLIRFHILHTSIERSGFFCGFVVCLTNVHEFVEYSVTIFHAERKYTVQEAGYVRTRVFVEFEVPVFVIEILCVPHLR